MCDVSYVYFAPCTSLLGRHRKNRKLPRRFTWFLKIDPTILDKKNAGSTIYVFVLYHVRRFLCLFWCKMLWGSPCTSLLGKCILRPRQAIFPNQRRYGQLIPKCVYLSHQGRFSKHAILLRRQATFQQQNKIGTLPVLIFKQSYFGREMVILGNAIFRPPGHDLGCLECGYHCNSIIVVFRPQHDMFVF